MRYFPRTCDPSCWQSWPLDMPGSEENSPSPDPAGGRLGPRSSSPSGGRAASRSPNSKRVEGKRCGVCGDRALGYNFNAITCESCKAFFRRNALKNKEYRCPFNDECEVTAVTRRFCQRCRLRKCFEIGMKKEWIMTEEEKKKKRKKIEENRARKVGDIDSSSSPGAVTSPMSTGGESSAALSPTNQNEEEEEEAAVAAAIQGFEALEEASRPPFSAEVDLPSLPQRQTTKVPTTKPKAVVVGRVREHENEAKVRKNCQQLDVHTAKAINSSLKIEEPSATRVAEDASRLLSDFSSTTLVSGLPPQFPLSFQVPMAAPEVAPSGSLVVGLLRSRSQGSAEDDSSVTIPGNMGCQVEGGSVIKFEALDEPLESYSPPPPVPLEPISLKPNSAQSLPFTSGSVGVPETYHCDEAKVFPSHSLQSAKFEFSVREALTMIQPGCKDASTSSSSNVMESIMNTAISAEYSAFSLLTNSHSSELNQAETIKITELLNASKGLNTPLCEEPNYKDLPNPSLINVINLTEIAIRRFIKMAKKISAFKTFCQEDQIALLKGGCTEMMILRSVSAYDPDKDAWKIQQDHERFKNIKLKILKAASGNVYEMHKRFMLSFHPEWRQDTMIIALLAAIALFTPERANVIHPEAVRHEQCSYLYLLKRYLESKYGGCVGKTNYMKLLEIIGNLHILNEDHVRVFLEVDPEEVEPLLIEIFDLKQS